MSKNKLIEHMTFVTDLHVLIQFKRKPALETDGRVASIKAENLANLNSVVFCQNGVIKPQN